MPPPARRGRVRPRYPDRPLFRLRHRGDHRPRRRPGEGRRGPTPALLGTPGGRALAPRGIPGLRTGERHGGGIEQWLLYRSAKHDLSLFALVVPPGAATPVHDHLAWGLVGLYRGEQEETVFARRDEEAPVGEREALSVKLRHMVRPGDFYPLLPPGDNVHAVRTTSTGASVSVHLLANGTGCV